MKTKVVLLGTGTPNPVPERSGPCVAVVVENQSYLVDFGSGVTRQAEKAFRRGIKALKVSNLNRAFLTHLHSDHTLGYADLILTPWVLERPEPLKVYGPTGTVEMTEHILAAYRTDIAGRQDGLEKANKTGIVVEATDITAGSVYQDEYVQVEAFEVLHPPFEAYGYRFTTPDKVIVISGDTAPCDNLIRRAAGCDILVHEVYSATGLKQRNPKWFKYHSTVHTASLELGEIAARVNPGKLVLYHQLFMVGSNEAGEMQALMKREQQILNEIRENFAGQVISAKDLEVIE